MILIHFQRDCSTRKHHPLYTKDSIQLLVTPFGKDVRRKQVGNCICNCKAKYNLPRIDGVLQWLPYEWTTRQHSVVQLSNLIVTGFFCVKIFASTDFNSSTYTEASKAHIPSLFLPQLLQDFVAMVYWLTEEKASTSAYSNYVRHSERYQGEILYLTSK